MLVGLAFPGEPVSVCSYLYLHRLVYWTKKTLSCPHEFISVFQLATQPQAWRRQWLAGKVSSASS